MSLGPGSLPSALGDASSRANRRTSFGGGSGDESSSTTIGGGEPPKKDRRAMLEEWRKSRAATATSSNNNNNSAAAVGISSQLQPPPPSSAPSPSRTSHYSYKKTQLSPIVASPQVDGNNNYNNGSQTYYNNGDNNTNNNNDSFEQQKEEETLPQMPKPPASAPSSTEDNTSGLSALERYRLRKQRQQQQQQQAYSGGSGGGNLMPPTPKSFGSNEHNNSSMSMINGGGGVGTPTHGGGSSRKHPPLPPSHSSSSHGEEDVEHTMTINMGGSYLGTPSRRSKSRGSSAISLGGAQRRVRRRTSLAPSDNMQVQQSQLNNNNPMNELQQQPVGRKSKPLLPPSYPGSNERSLDNNNTTTKFEVDEQPPQPPQPSLQAQPHSSERSNELVIEQQQQLAQYQQQHPTPTATTTTTTSTFSQESVESIDSAALKSRLQAMQRRIDNLEREKFELSMSKAPLEARIRQKEDAWVKERERLCAEIENYQLSSKDVDERYRELEMKNEALEEQNKSLRLEARASASNSNNGGGGSAGSGYYDDGGAKDSWSERLKSNNEIKDLRKEIKNKDDEIKSLRIEKVSLESEVFGCQQEIETLERNYDELEKDYQELESSKSQNSEAEIQLQVLTTEHTAMTAQLNATCADLEEMKTRHKADLKSKEDAWKERESQLLFEMSVLKSRAGKSVEGPDDDDDNDEASEMDPAILKARIEERDRRITELEEQLLSGEQLRRALHNRIQELRGNIRVYVRTRPFLPNDGAARGQMSIDFQPDGESLSIQGKHVGESHAFKFDKVFAPSTGQDMVFDEVSEFVQSALDGYNVCLFSYGQTGKLFPFFFCLCCAC